MKTLSKTGIFLLFATIAMTANAQSKESLIRNGNSNFKKGNFNVAADFYKKSLDTKYNDKAQFNLGDAYYQQKNFEEAASSFSSVADRNVTPQMEADAYYNLGNTMMEQQKYEEAFNAFKKCIKLNPQDEDARYNLEYARKKMIRQQQQQQQQQQNQDQNKDQNKDQDKQDKQQDQNQNQQQQQQNQEQNKEEQEQQQNQQQQQEQQMSKEDAERMLQALQEQEKNTMDKMNEAKAAKMQRRKIQKDW